MTVAKVCVPAPLRELSKKGSQVLPANRRNVGLLNAWISYPNYLGSLLLSSARATAVRKVERKQDGHGNYHDRSQSPALPSPPSPMHCSLGTQRSPFRTLTWGVITADPIAILSS